MPALVLVLGAVVVFALGWAMGRYRGASTDAPDRPVDERAPLVVGAVLERHPTGVVVAGVDGAIEYRNAAARDMAGTHVGILIDEAVERHLDDARKGTSGDEVLELFGPPKRVLVIAGEPLPRGGAVAFVNDITEQRRADRARTDFVANVSHELRTPIGALTVLAETLVGTDDSEVIDRIVDRMLAEADRAARTIDDLLELSEIESPRERELASVAVARVVSDAVERVGELAERRSISIAVRGADAEADGLVVRGDAPQLVSAVGNVVENAVKYSEPGARVSVDVAAAGDVVEISVRDEGIGIPRQDLDRIFERFYRVDRARRRETGGTGLGLSIVRHVVQNHNGSVSVTSTEGAGSEFVVRLPILAATDRDVGADEQRHEEVV